MCMLMAAALARGETVHRERRPRAGSRQPRRLPERHGRQDPPAPAPRPSPSTVSISLHGARVRVIPDRIETGTYAMAVAMTGGDVLLKDARPDLFRRRSTSSPRPAPKSPDQQRHPREAQRRRHLAGRRHHRAFPRLPDRPAGPVHGPDDQGQGQVAHHRDDLRKSLHACAGTGPSRRPDHAVGQTAIVEGVEASRARP
jgi:hypothetical protein